MEIKNMFAIAAVLLLLASPLSFAREAESGGNHAAIAPAASVAVSDDGTADQGKGDVSSTSAAAQPETGEAKNSDGSVVISLSAAPQEARAGDSITVTGIVAYTDNSPSMAAVAPEKKFKVELKMTGADGSSLSGRSGAILFKEDESSDSRGRGSDDVLGNAVRAVSSIFGSRDSSSGSSSDDSDDDGSASQGSTGGVASVVGSNSGSASQERTDYITLKSGEKREIPAYFVARTPGVKVAKMEVYEYTGTSCPDPNADRASLAPCKEEYRKIAEAFAKVRVLDAVPPLPPANTTNTTVASAVISLNSGWNMVSVPVASRVSMQQLVKECGSQDFAWRYTQNGYVKDDALAPGYGYWVKAANRCSISVSGNAYASTLAPLSAGWNLVGAPGQEVQFSAYSGNCQVTAGPWHYGPTAASDNQYALSSTLSPGKAYWIKAASACSLGSSEGMPPAPPA